MDVESEEAEAELSQSSCPAYAELLEVMDRATARLELPWKRAKEVTSRGRLDERYLSGHRPPAQVSLPFLPDLHTEIKKEWKRPFSSRIYRSRHTSYANIESMRESGYGMMPAVEETLASYLSLGEASSLNPPSLPSVPLQATSRTNGKAYGTAELRRTTDLALRATKQAASAMGRAMAARVVTERQLWVNLADIGKKERGFLLDAPVSPSELFGTSVETVVDKFREAKSRSAAFKSFIPRRPRSEPEQTRGPGPSRIEDQRRAQRASVATRAPPPPVGGGRRGRGSRGGRRNPRGETWERRQRFRPGQSNT
ncbi:uncharacterized protein LOC107667797 [Sinocyclocheilus anshuiensis]|uniref:uncharacterized protein LOC107667797 n=1 Tax=Sinocyclocheilus anshuiensis TaxID=1608454 RepID=UPI0007B7E329|nr:PREDICTED: uncharacterized protein LOC107667797 [Sinocyclocheilus anshuiensis]